MTLYTKTKKAAKRYYLALSPSVLGPVSMRIVIYLGNLQLLLKCKQVLENEEFLDELGEMFKWSISDNELDKASMELGLVDIAICMGNKA